MLRLYSHCDALPGLNLHSIEVHSNRELDCFFGETRYRKRVTNICRCNFLEKPVALTSSCLIRLTTINRS